MTPTKLALTMRRNENPMSLRFDITDDGTPVDMTPYVIRLQVRLRPGAVGDALLTVTTSASVAGSVITPDTAGFDLVIYKADLVNMPAGLPNGEVNGTDPFIGAYDILMSGPGGDEPWYYGDFILYEGVVIL